MAKDKKTEPAKAVSQHDYILLDRSGSMAGRWSDALGGVNAYVHGLAKNAETKNIPVSVAVFDTAEPFVVLRKDVRAADWRDISDSEASPRGGTPLYDAVGRLVTVADADAPEKSAVVIMTDGLENASREHTRESIKALLDRCRARGWQVIFLGADFDNAAQGAELGNSHNQTVSMDSLAIPTGMAATASMRASYSATGQAMNYTAKDRAAWSSPPKAKARGLSGAR